jgi:hypothetical protein
MRTAYRRLFGLAGPAERAVLTDVESSPSPPDAEPVLRRIAAETVILQDEAETVLRDIRARQGLGFIAPRAGPLVRRFFGLRDQLLAQVCAPAHLRLRDEMAAILHSHAMALSVAMDFLASEWRSATLAGQVDALTDLGPPARRIEEIYALLVGRT